MALKRRRFIKSAVAASAVAMLGQTVLASSNALAKQRVVIIGGGFSGATAAKYIRLWGPHIEVIMIERNNQFISCPQSNLVLSGIRKIQQLTRNYHGLNKYGVQTVQAQVTAIDTDKQTVSLHDGVSINYDRLVLAPGVDFIYEDLPMLASYDAQQKIPHAWKAGPQTTLLQKQIVEMKQGGTVVMAVPNGPLRCPPGPYERACQIAYYLKNNNPTAKLLVLDANVDIMSKKRLFSAAWNRYYTENLEYIPNSAIEDIDIANLQVETEFDSYSADVLNVIPPQKAGKIAEIAGVINVDNSWCQIDFLTYESIVNKNVHIIGDAIAAKLPKSGHMANAEAKVCAAAIVNLLSEQSPEQQPVINNTCYSFVDNQQAMHVAAVYRYDNETATMKVMPGGGMSEQESKLEGKYANEWAKNIWADMIT